MNTLWTAAPVARVHADGVARARPADDDPLFRSDDDVSTTTAASASAPAGGEEDDTVGELRVRVGRIDAWREQGFASAREQREHHRSDLFRYNQRRKRAGRAPVTESEFQAMLEGGDEVSSISGSDDSDSESDDDDDDDDGSNAATKNLRALHGKAEGAQTVFVGEDGVPFGVWRCLLRPDATKAADADATANVAPEEALRALRSDPSRPWVVLLARGGHFAGAVFDPRKLGGGSGADERQQKGKGGEGVRGGPLALVPPACAVAHKTFHRYVVRAKAGGRQSVKDQGGKTIKSAGSSIRRANEAALQREVLETLESWRERLDDAALVFVAASATDQRTLFEGKNPPLSRRDARVRRIPFATQRPTFNEARRVMARLAAVNYKMAETDGANDDDASTNTRGGSVSVRSSDVTNEGTKHRHRREDEDGEEDARASAGALTPAQAARLAAMHARAAEAAAEAAAAMRLDEHLDEHLAENAEDIKILSKKEKEKLKKARAKERQKAEKAAERAANAADDETEKTVANGVGEGTSSAPSKATKAAKTAAAKGGKAAALLAKAKQAEAAKRDEKVRDRAATRASLSRHSVGFRFFFDSGGARPVPSSFERLSRFGSALFPRPRARVAVRRLIPRARRSRVPPTNESPPTNDARRRLTFFD